MKPRDTLFTRREVREVGLRLVEYTGYPRAQSQQLSDAPRLALALDQSDHGLRIDTSDRLVVGALLRVTVCDIDGTPQRESLARVAWRGCSTRGAGRFTAGLALIENEAIRDIPVGYRPGRRNIPVSA